MQCRHCAMYCLICDVKHALGISVQWNTVQCTILCQHFDAYNMHWELQCSVVSLWCNANTVSRQNSARVTNYFMSQLNQGFKVQNPKWNFISVFFSKCIKLYCSLRGIVACTRQTNVNSFLRKKNTIDGWSWPTVVISLEFSYLKNTNIKNM